MRWTPSRKQDVLRAIDNGEATEAEIMRAHEISQQELKEWRDRYSKGGAKALRVTRKVRRLT